MLSCRLLYNLEKTNDLTVELLNFSKVGISTLLVDFGRNSNAVTLIWVLAIALEYEKVGDCPCLKVVGCVAQTSCRNEVWSADLNLG